MQPKEDIKVAAIQSTLYWEDVEANLNMFSQHLEAADEADIYVLPEMFTTGFSMQPEKFAEKSQTEGEKWLKQMAKQKQAAIVGSMMVADEGKYYNRLYFVTPNGQFYTYVKRHLFSLGNEQEHYSAGNQKLIVEYLGWKICPLICYDLRFPVWSRNTDEYDLLIYVANWPEKRAQHWQKLLVARAIENQCYTIGCNRIGDDGNGIGHNGASMIVRYDGEVMASSLNVSKTLTASLSKSNLKVYRNKFPFLLDSENFSIL